MPDPTLIERANAIPEVRAIVESYHIYLSSQSTSGGYMPDLIWEAAVVRVCMDKNWHLTGGEDGTAYFQTWSKEDGWRLIATGSTPLEAGVKALESEQGKQKDLSRHDLSDRTEEWRKDCDKRRPKQEVDLPIPPSKKSIPWKSSRHDPLDRPKQKGRS